MDRERLKALVGMRIQAEVMGYKIEGLVTCREPYEGERIDGDVWMEIYISLKETKTMKFVSGWAIDGTLYDMTSLKEKAVKLFREYARSEVWELLAQQDTIVKGINYIIAREYRRQEYMHCTDVDIRETEEEE